VRRCALDLDELERTRIAHCTLSCAARLLAATKWQGPADEKTSLNVFFFDSPLRLRASAVHLSSLRGAKGLNRRDAETRSEARMGSLQIRIVRNQITYSRLADIAPRIVWRPSACRVFFAGFSARFLVR
jgi:hypothetical protein